LKTQIPQESNKILREIGQSLVDNLPENFIEAWLHAEINAPGTYSLDVFYKKTNGRIGYLDDGIENIDPPFSKLYNAYLKDAVQPFTQLDYHLTNKYEMNVHMGYDDVSDIEHEDERRNDWMKKTFGDLTLIDWD
jgi:hypothetical protein